MTGPEDLLNRAVQAASQASRERVEKSQVEGLLSFLNERNDVNELLFYIMRQSARGSIGRNTARLLVEHIRGIKGDVESVRRYLGYFKWAYEVVEKNRITSPLDNFNKLVDAFLKR
ncbi:hypothetical protein IG193_08670 [Infirmifilum lucidum]|uniref:Uncharacterized protein n=1 Tax=Infirmifilum lucidum TaxID=2776706 RepID=A0A7L9FIT3_9CREN|nr:hypothetical protein [Infirmifilum lucidum]QOJ78806.1 hypothetical protein IG193_08670 [Infirmifilum lucidum]